MFLQIVSISSHYSLFVVYTFLRYVRKSKQIHIGHTNNYHAKNLLTIIKLLGNVKASVLHGRKCRKVLYIFSLTVLKSLESFHTHTFPKSLCQ